MISKLHRSAASVVRIFGRVHPRVCLNSRNVCSRSNLRRKACHQRSISAVVTPMAEHHSHTGLGSRSPGRCSRRRPRRDLWEPEGSYYPGAVEVVDALLGDALFDCGDLDVGSGPGAEQVAWREVLGIAPLAWFGYPEWVSVCVNGPGSHRRAPARTGGTNRSGREAEEMSYGSG